MKLPQPFRSFSYILASQSPRRQQLMREMGFDFRVEIREIDETPADETDASGTSLIICEAKAAAFPAEELKEREILITADTLVWQEGKMLGKPADAEEAFRMLSTLSGKSHEVFTGVCLKSRHQQHSFFDRAEVFFRSLRPEQIKYYVDEYQPFDKAGAYGVQEWIGYIGVEKIIGSFYNVMGLPTQLLIPELERFLVEEERILLMTPTIKDPK